MIAGVGIDLVVSKGPAPVTLEDFTGKPVADGRLDPGTVWFVLAVGVFVVVPLSIANGVYAGSAYLISLGVLPDRLAVSSEGSEGATGTDEAGWRQLNLGAVTRRSLPPRRGTVKIVHFGVCRA